MMHRIAMFAAPLLVITHTALADDWIIGADDPNEIVTLTSDHTVDGDILIVNNAQLNIRDDAMLTLTGDIVLTSTATLDVDGATLRFSQVFGYQGGILATDKSSLIFTDSTVRASGLPYSINLFGSASAQFTRITVEDGFTTWALCEQSSATLTDCVKAGEFVPFGDVSLTITGSDLVLLWVTLFDGSVLDTTFPPPGDLDSFTLGPDTPWATNIPYSVSLSDCTDMMWAIMARSGSSATVRDSTLRAIGTYFERDNTIEITGVANNATLTEADYQWGDVAYHLTDTSVQSWNFYAYGTTHLTLKNCIFGELLANEQGEAWVEQSLCDGSGGYIGAFENSVVYLIFSSNLSQTTTRHQAGLVCFQSSLLNSAADALDESMLLFVNAQYVGEPVAHDSAAIFDAAVDPVRATVGNTVALRGTSRMIVGPTSPFTYEGYVIEYGVGYEPTEWLPIAGPITDEVRHATLAEWNTIGLHDSPYTLRLSLLNNLGEPTEAAAAAVLFPPIHTGDLNGDGSVDQADLGILLAAYGLNGTGDCDGDGDTDQADLGILLANYGSGV